MPAQAPGARKHLQLGRNTHPVKQYVVSCRSSSVLLKAHDSVEFDRFSYSGKPAEPCDSISQSSDLIEGPSPNMQLDAGVSSPNLRATHICLDAQISFRRRMLPNTVVIQTTSRGPL